MKMPDRPRGALVEDWQPRLRPAGRPLVGARGGGGRGGGRWEAGPPRPSPAGRLLFGADVAVEPLDVARHAPALWQAFAPDTEGRLWDYMGYGPFANEIELAST